MSIDNGGPAFPEAGLSGLPSGEFMYGREGMTLRDYFAAKAMQGFCANIGRNRYSQENIGVIAIDAYAVADAMLNARGQS